MTRSKKILSILMSLVMIVLSIPAFSLTAHAEDTTTITHLDLTYDTGKIVLNTAYTEGEVQNLLRVSKNMAIATYPIRTAVVPPVSVMVPIRSLHPANITSSMTYA